MVCPSKNMEQMMTSMQNLNISKIFFSKTAIADMNYQILHWEAKQASIITSIDIWKTILGLEHQHHPLLIVCNYLISVSIVQQMKHADEYAEPIQELSMI